MARPPRPIALAVLALAALAASPTGPADEAENYRLLQAMPRERRVALAENLVRFDKLDPGDRAAIRKLDAELARRDPVEQARYRALLRRYHLWVNGLTDEQRQALKAAENTDARFALARKYRLKEAGDGGPPLRIAGVRTGELGLIGPFEAAHMLRVWGTLTPARKADIEKQQERGRLVAAIRAETRASGVKFEAFPAAERPAYATRLEGDPAFKMLLGPMARGVDPASKKLDATQKKAEAGLERLEHPLIEFLYFEDHRPHAVADRDLERFAASCPAWLKAMTDPLSPDDARDYLTILYRLIYPHPREMPADPKPARTPSSPRPGPRKGPAPAPF